MMMMMMMMMKMMEDEMMIFDDDDRYNDDDETVSTLNMQEKEAAWESERKKPNPDLNVKFVYAYVLSRSSMERHKITGIRLLNGM